MTFNKNLLTATLLTVAGLTAVSSANAETTLTNSSFAVNMTVTSVCTVASAAGDIDFSDILANTVLADASITNKPSTGIAVSCSEGTPYVINLTSVNAAANNTGIGSMKGSEGNTDAIAYQLHSDPSGTKIWGNGATVGMVGNGVGDTGIGVSDANTHLVYATVTDVAGSDVKIDDYSDTINVSVSY